MIIAVDFDGVLCKDEFPDIGSPNYEIVSFVRQLIDQGHEVILWTSRVEERLTEAVNWCEDRGLHFVAVNDNAPSNKEQYKGVFNVEPRKIYADIYIDDHNIEYNLCRCTIDPDDLMIVDVRKGVESWKL